MTHIYEWYINLSYQTSFLPIHPWSVLPRVTHPHFQLASQGLTFLLLEASISLPESVIRAHASQLMAFKTCLIDISHHKCLLLTECLNFCFHTGIAFLCILNTNTNFDHFIRLFKCIVTALLQGFCVHL